MNYCKLLVLTLFLFTNFSASAGQAYTIASGNFGNTSIWNTGSVPGSNDTIIISAGDTVLVYQTVSGLEGVWLQVYGRLEFRNSRFIQFEISSASVAASMITFYSGFFLSGGNGSSGISFGAGGSGCDVYRPATGATPGVFPSNGSYYDGCTWASYLSVKEIWTHAELKELTMQLEWKLTEPETVLSYEIHAGNEAGEESIQILSAKNPGEFEHYVEYIPVQEYTYFKVDMHLADGSTETIYTVDINQVIAKNASIDIYPNPFKSHMTVTDRTKMDIRLISMDGTVIMDNRGQSTYQLDTEELSPGFYILEVFKEGRQVRQEKLIKY
jgi:hypothetical protein